MKVGRKKLKKSVKRSHKITFALNDAELEEYREIKSEDGQAHLSDSAYIRARVLKQIRREK